MKIHRFLASDYLKLDSSVFTGGGTDDTLALQALLDTAKNGDGVYITLDGAALVSHLTVYSNTTIECLSTDCGFFQIAGTSTAILTNADWDDETPRTRNISLIGGTYNQDCIHQEHHTPYYKSWFKEGKAYEAIARRYTFGLEFYGVKNLLVRGLTIRNFRTFALAVGCFENVTIENTWLDLPDHVDASNQDGFHFWGPGRFLTVKNVGGRVGDDFMNLGPDERDKVSSITDVLIDGVFLDHADQALRLLSRDKGRLDRVTIRNISGNYKSFGFYINPWFGDDTLGSFGNIFIENVDLQAEKPNYDYRPPMLFSIGGNIELLKIKNVRSHASTDNRTLFEIGYPYARPDNTDLKKFGIEQKLETIVIEDLLVTEKEGDPKDTDYIGVYAPVDRLTLDHATVIKPEADDSSLLTVGEEGKISTLITEGIYAENLTTVIRGEDKIEKKIER
ncbi:MAG: hypothetical protein MJ141_02865 [Clostridia bacterium]|nr:hypothetical protein [Clostridia bacterium]